MNILIIPPNDLLRHPIPNRLYHLAKEFSKNHKVFILPYPGHPIADKNKKLRDLECLEVSFNYKKSKNIGIYYLKNYFSMKRSLSETIKDIEVVIHSNILPSYIVTKLCKKFKIFCVCDYLDHFPQSASAYYPVFINFLVEFLTNWVVKKNLKMSDKIVTVSYELKDMIEREVGKKVYLIPNGFEPEIFKPMPMDKCREKLYLDLDKVYMLYYGSIDNWIDFSIPLKILKKFTELNFLIVGGAHNKSFFRKLKKDVDALKLTSKIKFFEPQPYEKIPLFINSADFVIAPFKDIRKNYGTPLKIIETLACKKPLITYGLEEFRKWFGDLPYYENIEDCIRIVEKILEGDFHEELEEKYDLVKNNFNWKILAEKYLRLLGCI